MDVQFEVRECRVKRPYGLTSTRSQANPSLVIINSIRHAATRTNAKQIAFNTKPKTFCQRTLVKHGTRQCAVGRVRLRVSVDKSLESFS